MPYSMFSTLFFRRWRNLEQTGENYWGLYCGCYLARRFEEAGVRHIHACWANGPATAAWMASALTGIPFSFSGRAGDIYPPDGALEEKIAHAAFARVDAAFNIEYLRCFAGGADDKIKLVRNSLSWESFEDAPAPMGSWRSFPGLFCWPDSGCGRCGSLFLFLWPLCLRRRPRW